jgi:hypothetical protein
MTSKQLWVQYQHYTRDITVHGRVLGFAGAAVCWLFKREDLTFPVTIYFALFFIVAYFIADVLHGLSGALMVKFYTEHQEAELKKANRSIDEDIEKPRWVDRPAFIFFVAKCILLIIGFAFIGLHLILMLVPIRA